MNGDERQTCHFSKADNPSRRRHLNGSSDNRAGLNIHLHPSVLITKAALRAKDLTGPDKTKDASDKLAHEGLPGPSFHEIRAVALNSELVNNALTIFSLSPSTWRK